MRGEQYAARYALTLSGGAIPACAGSSRHFHRAGTELWGHPRMRGEQPTPNEDTCDAQGPSPHARGAVTGRVCGGDPLGAIPACAGSRVFAWKTKMNAGGHPRMRGEQPDAKALTNTPEGPSPHARGAVIHGMIREVSLGAIPACAGSRP